MTLRESLNWEVDGADWPHRQASRFVDAANIRWHVQCLGSGPVVLLVHGTGAGSFSWRSLASLLAERFTVLMPDLPGHAFTHAMTNSRPTLQGMSYALGELLRVLQLRPVIAVGHSAGAAIVIRMTLDGCIAPHAIVSVNGALLPPGGFASVIFSPVAKLLAKSSLIPRLFAKRAADPAALQRLLDGTGSTLDAAGMDLYRHVVSNSVHVSGVLDMMANWNLDSIRSDIGRLRSALVLVVGENDLTVDPGESRRVQSLLPSARIVSLPGLGHLAHEEQPERVAQVIEGIAAAESR